MTVRAVYENGVFKPTEPVNLPEKTRVEVTVETDQGEQAQTPENQDRIYAILRERYESGERDVAERHDEHQP